MKTAVVLVNYNGQKYLPELFASLAKLNFPANKADIFFVDNASEDNSLVYAQKHADSLGRKVIFIQNKENFGFAKANNIALRQVLKSKKYKYVVLLNMDTVVDTNWLSRLIKTAEQDGKIGAVQSLILLHDKPKFINTAGNCLHYLGFGWSGGYKESVASFKFSVSRIGYASGASVLYRTDVLQKIGLLDEKFFMYHEDLELSWRIRLAGYKIVLSKESLVYHKYQFSRHAKKWFWTEKNRLLVFFSMYNVRTIILFMPILIFMEVIVMFYSLFSGWFVYKIRSYIEVFKLIPYIIKKRQHIRLIRTISDQEVLKHMETRLSFPQVKSMFLDPVNVILERYFNIF